MATRPKARLRQSLCALGAAAVLTLQSTSIAVASSQASSSPRFEPVSIQGLSHETVSSIAQDRRGFLWFGTWDGLTRWDGRSVQNFSFDARNSQSLPNSSIAKLLVDHRGDLWAATLGGVGRYDSNDNRIFRFDLPGAQEPRAAANGFRWTLHEDPAGTLWLGSASGLYIFHPASGQFRQVDAIDSSGSRQPFGVVSMNEDTDGTLWLMSNDWPYQSASLFQVRGVGPDGQYIQMSRRQVSDQRSVSFLIDREGRFWMGGTVAKVPAVDGVGFVDLAPDPYQAPTSAHLLDRAGRVWIGTFSGLFVAQPGADAADPVMLGDRRGFLDEFVLSIFEDDAGTIWVSTIAGVYRHDPARKPFFTLQENPEFPQYGLTSNRVASIAREAGGDLWVGTWGEGIDRIDSASGQTENFAPNSSGLPASEAYFVFADSRNSIWVAAAQHLCHFERATDRFACATPGSGAGNERFWTLTEGPEGTIFLASNAFGLLEFDPESRLFLRLLEDLEETNLVQALSVNEDTLWMVTVESKLIALDLQTGDFGVIDLSDAWQGMPAAARDFYDLHIGANGNIWVGTSNGLISLDTRSGATRRYDRYDGLPGSYIYSILEEGSGKLWLSTNRGLVRFDPQAQGNRRFRSFDRIDGISGMEFNRRAKFRAADGSLYFGGKGGITWFHPEEIEDNAYVPPVALGKVSLSDADGQSRTLHDHTSGLVMGPRDQVLNLQFAALSFTDPTKNLYRYRLDPFDSTWVEAGTRNFATYTSIPAGDYVFLLQGSNNDGLWNQAGLSLPVRVIPPFWATWWFRTLMVLLIIATLLAAHRWRVARLVEIERLRTRIAGDLHDDFSSDLSGIALTMDLLENNPRLDQRDRVRIAQVRSTAVRMIDGVRDLVWYLDAGHDSMTSLWARMRKVADTMLAGREVTMCWDDSADRFALDMTLRRQVYLIFKELMHNVVKHSNAKRVWVDLTESRGEMVLKVRDNGVGFDQNNNSRGYGIDNLKKRAELVGGKLEIESAVNAGTLVTLAVPVRERARIQMA